MLSILITTYREAHTIGRALDAFLPQLPAEGEIVVVCPDAETTTVIQQYATRYPHIRHIPDPGEGKPTALNIGLQTARGDLIVFSDGDVVVGEQALAPLLAPFTNPQVGAVTGRPVSISPRDNKLGYWSHLLVEGAHRARLARDAAGQFLLCSGYLFAARKSLIPSLPANALAEDAVISHRIAEQGYAIRYAPAAEVYVKYPTTYADWRRQKTRSAGGYAQDYVRRSPYQMRSARREVQHGFWHALTFAQTPRELWWTLQLFAARLHLWGSVWWQVRVRQRPLPDLWQRVESTK
ncbi:MAG: glycosyltransferase [Anaerolineae bacterium]|nr:glycosyltransferase [Anaerolineae bacterium]